MLKQVQDDRMLKQVQDDKKEAIFTLISANV